MLKHSRRIQWFIGACLLLLLPIGFAIGQDDTELRWSSPRFVGDGWWQSIAIDQHGDVHIGWYGSNDPEIREIDGDVFSYARRSLDGEWTPINNVLYTGTGGFTVRNAMAVTSDGTLNLVYRNSIFHAFSNAYSKLAENASAWSPPTVIDSTGYYVNMIADENDVLHVVTSERLDAVNPGIGAEHAELNPCALCHDLFYRRSTDGGESWSDPYPLSINATTGSDKPDIFQGRSGRLYISWDEGYDWYIGRGSAQDVRIVYSDDAGLTWSAPIILDGGNFVDRKPVQIATTELRDGSLLVVWRYNTNLDRNIYYQLSSDVGKTWTEPKPIPGLVAQDVNDSVLDDYALITDRIGTAHLFAVGQPDVLSTTRPSLYHIRYRQGVWLPPQRVYYAANARPEWPKAVIGPQNDIHLTWFIRGTDNPQLGQPVDNTDILEVYYSYLPGIFPLEATQAFSPTRTPYPTATVFQKLDPTPTPFPTIETVDATSPVQSQDQYAAQTLTAGLFAATAFCAAVLLVVRIRRGQ